MVRQGRVVIPDAPHHVTQRGNRRQQAFFCDAGYVAYLQPPWWLSANARY